MKDTDDGDASLLAVEAAQLRDTLRHLLLDGAIFLAEARGTLVHTALAAIQGRTVYFKKGGLGKSLVLGWPAPGDVQRTRPIELAKQLFKQYMTFFDSHFPMWDVQNGFSAFNLAASLSLKERQSLLESVARHRGVDHEAAWQAFVGDGVRTGALQLAKWHHDRPALSHERPAMNQDGGPQLRDPECPNLRAWIRTYRHLLRLGEPGRRGAFLTVLEDYLVVLPGTPVVERWLGEVAMQEVGGRAHKEPGTRLVRRMVV